MILADVGLFLFPSYAAVCLFLHMIEDFLIEFFEACSELLVFFPDLNFVEFGVVGEFGHVLVSL